MTELVHQESVDPSSSRQNTIAHLSSFDAINLHTLADATVANLPAPALQNGRTGNSNRAKAEQITITQVTPSSSSPSGSVESSTSSPESLGQITSPAVSHKSTKIDEDGSTAGSVVETSQTAQQAKRRKVDHACVYCRRSHMTCDSGRPCSRCVKRNIGHLCHDENKEQKQKQSPKENEASSLMSRTTSKSDSKMSSITYGISSQGTSAPLKIDNSASPKEWSMMNGSSNILTDLTPYQAPLFFSEHAGSEFSSLNDFLTMLEDAPMPLPVPASPSALETATDPLMLRASSTAADVDVEGNGVASEDITSPLQGMRALDAAGRTTSSISHLSATANGNLTLTTPSKPPQVPETAKDKFFLTAADPADGPEHTPEERLKQVINAKLEAGLLTPFNYVKGYARLQRYMDRHMSPASRQRILKPLSIFRPAFRAIAQTLIDVDLVLVEEAFERMLLDYDRVFTSMAIPACLWRRTGEIYRGNKEFAALVEVPVEELRDGKLAIYELLSEDSAVNYWEKYGNIAFDSGQKAVLTSCTLKSRDGTRRACCFSFTIRRDRYNIPSCIIGNFIPIHP
ncbi:hypothetical protein V1525DRAFT_393386 [Lipomyces kononenkoae]|uniref:Uncharacterized protein n=1 Tax=Lipomyces kononenkoae TaxID=34357 RepID=A0ACC3TAP2_LIPKO